MDLISIIKNDTSGSILKRLSPSSSEGSIDEQYDAQQPDKVKNAETDNKTGKIVTDSNEGSLRKVSADENKDGTPTSKLTGVPKDSESRTPRRNDYNGISNLEEELIDDSINLGDKKIDDKKVVKIAESKIKPRNNDPDKLTWNSEKLSEKLEGDLNNLSESKDKFISNLKGQIGSVGEDFEHLASSLATKPLNMLNGVLSMKRAHLNMNHKMLGRFYALNDSLGLASLLPEGEASAPYKKTPLYDKLAFLEKVPKITEIDNLLLDKAKELLKNKLKKKLDLNLQGGELELDKLNPAKKVDLKFNKRKSPFSPNHHLGKGSDDLKIDITNETKWAQRYEINNDKHLGPYFKGFADISLFEGRTDRFYDFEIYAPEALKSNGLPPVPVTNKGLFIDKAADITEVKSISLSSGDTISLGDFGSPIKSIKLEGNVASISTDIYETEDIAVRKWLQSYIKYMYGDNPTPLVHRSIFQGYYYVTFYYLDVDRSVIQERTFYGIPQFDLSLTPEPGTIKKFSVNWNIIGESPTREA